MVEHVTNMCPTLQDGSYKQANVVGGFLGQLWQKYDLY